MQKIINNINDSMYNNLYKQFLSKSFFRTKLNMWVVGRKIPKTTLKKILVIPKGIFFRSLKISKNQIGIIGGRLVSSRKPFVRPIKEIRR